MAIVRYACSGYLHAGLQDPYMTNISQTNYKLNSLFPIILSWHILQTHSFRPCMSSNKKSKWKLYFFGNTYKYQCCKNLVKIWQRLKFFLHFCCLHGHERIRSANMEEAVFLVCLTNYGHVCMDLEVLHGEWRYAEHAYITIAMKNKF